MLAKEWNVHGNLGLVVGANHPEALARVRSLVPDNWILAPGVGAQGGDLQAALHAGLRSDGLGLLIPVSRLLSRAENPRRIGNELIRQINLVRSEVQGSRIESRDSRPVISPIHQSSYDSPITNLDSRLSTLADRLLDAGCIQFGQFTLKSGMQSPIYIDLRRLVSLPELLAQVAAAYLPHLHALTFDRLAALPYAAIPIATAISLQGDWPLIYPRKEAKSYGTRAEIEGIFQPGERVVVIDDLATTGGSKFEAIHKLVEAGLLVSDVVVLVDRQSGAAGALSQGGYLLHSVFTLTQLIDHWRQKSLITPEQYTATLQFLRRET
jgi:uridine monophosphate synthetase